MKTVLPFNAFDADVVIVQPGVWDIHFGKGSEQNYRVNLKHLLDIFRDKHLIFLHLLPDYSGGEIDKKYAIYNNINQDVAQNFDGVLTILNFSSACSEDMYKNAVHPNELLNRRLGSLLLDQIRL